MSYKSPLGNMQGPSMDVERIKREGWKENEILVVNIDDWRLLKGEKELLRKIGNRLYGESND